MRTRLVGIPFVIIVNDVSSVLELPSVRVVPLEVEIVSRPVHLILEAAMRESRIKDIVNFPLFIVVDDDGIGRDKLLSGQRVFRGEPKEASVKYVVNIRADGQVQFVRVTLLTNDFVWSDHLVIELLAGPRSLDVLC